MAKTLNISLFPIHNDVDHTHIVSAGEYIVLDHFLRKLIKVDKHGGIQSDLAESWDIDHAKRKIKFKIKKDQKFSNGETISIEHIMSSYLLQKEKGTATHYNFSLIKKINKLSSTEFEMLMDAEINIDLFTSLSQPEFGVIYNSKKPNDYSISSGPFYLESLTSDIFHLSKNLNYGSNGPIQKIKINRKGVEKESFKKLADGELDFYVPYTGISTEDSLKIQKSKNIVKTSPNIGFTYWLSLNPKLIKDDSRKALRNKLEVCMNNFKLDFGGWERARQLVFPNSFGAMNEKEMDKIYSGKHKYEKKGTTYKFLTFKGFSFNKEIEKCITDLGDKVETVLYADQKELSNLIKKNDYHIVLNNNDFASLNVLKNFKWAFNESRPLFFLGEYKEKCLELIEQGYKESDKQKRERIVIELQNIVLGNSLAVPLAYKRVSYIHKKEISLDKWPMNFPFINFDQI
ncbi:MAG: hypothetical protein KC493_12970 [Bacteriovoracaceae bacterium]|nr:hypothetical protein [Bacteriovoracaceae bacterium]